MALSDLRTLLALIAALGLYPFAVSAKDCVVPWSLEVKRVHGEYETVVEISPAFMPVSVEVELNPGDSLIVDLDPNEYCGWAAKRLTVRQGFMSESEGYGPVLHILQGEYPHRFIFREIGELRMAIEQYLIYAGTALITVSESATSLVVGVLDPAREGYDLNVTCSNGLLFLGPETQGRLLVLDLVGRRVLQRDVQRNSGSIPIGSNPAGVYVVVVISDQGLLSWRRILLE